jgi:hypothetical protein
MIIVGPNFDRGARKIGRRRLPQGSVAITDDPPLLRAAISELRTRTADLAGRPVEPCGIIFRIVTVDEAQAIRHRIINLHGVDWANRHGHVFIPPAEHWHILGLDALIHAHNRHSDEETERQHGHLPLVAEDYHRIPEIVTPHWITSFVEKNGMPRVIYERTYAEARLIVVEELRMHQGLVMKTLYKRRP